MISEIPCLSLGGGAEALKRMVSVQLNRYPATINLERAFYLVGSLWFAVSSARSTIAFSRVRLGSAKIKRMAGLGISCCCGFVVELSQ